MTSMGKVQPEDTARNVESRRKKRRNRVAIAWRDQTIAKLFSEIKRVRPLNPEEKQLFDRALAGLGPKREVWHWTEKEDRALLKFMARRHRTGRPQPFKPNDEILNLAVELGRSYMAVHRRIERLRKRGKCSDAGKRAKG